MSWITKVFAKIIEKEEPKGIPLNIGRKPNNKPSNCEVCGHDLNGSMSEWFRKDNDKLSNAIIVWTTVCPNCNHRQELSPPPNSENVANKTIPISAKYQDLNKKMDARRQE